MGNLFEDNSLFTPSIEKQGKSSANLSDIKNNVFDSKKKFENQEHSFMHLSETTNVSYLKKETKDQKKSSSQISDINDLFVNDVSDSKKKI
jgi:pyruvate/2-oxoacid:ferredoxin oxidoreductase beta subunit